MKVKITRTTVSKKGTVWIQASIVEGETPRCDEVYNCEVEENNSEKEGAEE